MGAEMTVLPSTCAWWAPTPRAEELVLPDRSRGGATDCALPWQEVQGLAPSVTTWSPVHAVHEMPTWPPEKSSPWHFWQVAKFQPAARTRLEWNSLSLGLRIPLSCTPERKSDSRPSTTHARTVSYAADTGACSASAWAGSMVVRSFEPGSPATATGEAVGPSVSR